MQASVLLVLQVLTALKVVHHRKAAGFVFKEHILQPEVGPALHAALVLQTATAPVHLIPNLQHFIGQAHLWFITHLQPIPVDPQYRQVLSRFRFPAGTMSTLEV